MSKNLFWIIFGVLFAPVAILLHECGHYAVAVVQGHTAHFHFAETITDYPQPASYSSFLWVVAGGPAVTALMTIGGLFWLWHLRRSRLQAAATCSDWLASFLVLCAIRWLRCFTGSPTHPQPKDEAVLSAGLGFPPWLLPYLLAPVALALLMVAVRLHPRGCRLVPFSSAIFGLCLGVILWLNVLGPRILP